jgi:ATP-dependent DNA helicase MPH1
VLFCREIQVWLKIAIAQLQRIGRAGRKRDGFIHVLATVGREDKNWDAAIFNHRDIQSEIIIGKNLELYDDAPLMLPGMPDCNRMIMSVDPWVDEVKTRGSKRKSKASTEKTPKRQRGDPVPTGSGGFIRASALTVGGKKVGGGKKGRRDSPSSNDDSEDLPTLGDAVRPKDRVEDLTSDSEMEVPPRSSRPSARSTKSGSGRSLAKKTPVKDKRKDLSSGSDLETGAGHPPGTKVPSLLSVIGVQSTKPKARTTKVIVEQDEDSTEENGYTGSSSSRTLDRPMRETEPYQTPPPPAPVQLPPTARTAGSEFSQLSGRWMLDLEDDEFMPEMPGAKILAKPFKAPTFVAGSVSSNMGPPASVPRSLTNAICPMPTPQVEDSPLVLRRRRRAIIPPSSDDREDSGAMIHLTAAAHDESSPVPAARVHKSKPRRTHKYVEEDLEVSGDDDGGTTEDTSGEESESDRRFAGHFQATQAPKGYNQRAAYLAGLSTQAPKDGPAFADRTAEHDLFMSKARRPILLSQEEPHPGPSSDYDGSFVCGDDTIDYDSGSDGLHE